MECKSSGLNIGFYSAFLKTYQTLKVGCKVQRLKHINQNNHDDDDDVQKIQYFVK